MSNWTLSHQWASHDPVSQLSDFQMPSCAKYLQATLNTNFPCQARIFDVYVSTRQYLTWLLNQIGVIPWCAVAGAEVSQAS